MATKDKSTNEPTQNDHVSAKEALERLKAGNVRFLTGEQEGVFSSVTTRRSQLNQQKPFAIVLGCADSRVPVEEVFDQGTGDIFTTRVAGNVVDNGTLASIQYAINHLNVRLVVVLGHEGCGAVNAALLSEQDRKGEPEAVQNLLNLIAPAVGNIPSIQDAKSKIREAVLLNVRYQTALLEQDSTVKEAMDNKKVKVIGAYYEIGSGAVEFLEG